MALIPAPPRDLATTRNPERPHLDSAGLGPCPFEPYSEEYLLEVVRKTFPAEYIRGLEQTGGFEALRMLAQQGARISQAISRAECGGYISWAEPGAKAHGIAYLYRADATRGAGIVKAGSLVGTSRGQVVRFRTLRDLEFGPSELGPLPTPIEAEHVGYEYNLTGEVVTASGEIIPGQIDTIYALVEVPDYFDPTFQVRQVEDTEGGRAELLEQQGQDRRVLRRAGEAIEHYRGRIKQIPDSISPAGLDRSLNLYLRAIGPALQGGIIETWQVQFQTCWDGPIGGGGFYDPTCFVYDDPRPVPPYRNRWLSGDGAQGGEFVTLVPALPCLMEFGFILDDPAMDAPQHTTPGVYGGRRGYSVYDLPDALPDAILPTCLDGYDSTGRAAYGGIWELMEGLRAGGVRQDLILIGT